MDSRSYGLLYRDFNGSAGSEGLANYYRAGWPPYILKDSDVAGDTSIVIQIPASLVVTGAAFREFMRQNRLDEVLEGLLAGVDVKSMDVLQSPADQMQEIIHSSPFPEQLCEHILEGCREMGHGSTVVWPVAMPFEMVRFSQQRQRSPYLEASGPVEIIQAIRTWWASLYDSAAIFYRELTGQRHRDATITLAAQRVLSSALNGYG